MRTILRLGTSLIGATLLAVAAGCSDNPTEPAPQGPGTGPAAPTSVFYVDQASGDDANNGAATRPFKTISAALAVADSADTIRVAPGAYGAGETFPLELPEALVLLGDEANKGDGAQPTEISGSGAMSITPGSVVVQEVTLVGAAGAQVRGFRFTSAGGPVYHFSIMIDSELAPGADAMVVTNNTFAGVYGGVVTWKGTGMQITDNVFDTDHYGALVIQSDQVAFDRNNVTCGQYGVDLALQANEAFVRDNEFFVDTTSGSGVRTQSGLTRITGNQVTYTGGGSSNSTAVFALSGSSVIRNNTFDTYRGILVWNAGAPDAGTPTEDGNNDFTACQGPAIEHNSTGTATIYGNQFRNTPPVLGDDVLIPGTGRVEGPFVATLWVDPVAGDDANPGTEAMPLGTITRALAIGGGGVPEVHLALGTYSAGETFPLVFPAGSKIVGASTDSFGRDLQIVGEGAYEVGTFDGGTIVALGDIDMERVSVHGSASPSFYFGLLIETGTATIRNCQFRDAYGGVFADFDVPLVNLQSVDANTSSYGVYANNVDVNQCYLTASLPYKAIAGRIFNSVVTVNHYSGAASTNGTLEVSLVAFRYSGNTSVDMSYGAIVTNYGTPKVRNCTFETPLGMTIRSSSQIDLGTATDPGNNSFAATDTCIVHQGTEAISAIGNTWVHTPPQVGADILLEGTGTVDTGTTP